MSRFKHFGVLLVAVTGIALSATEARATIQAQISINGGAAVTLNSGGSTMDPSGTVTIQFQGSTNSPGSSNPPPPNAGISQTTVTAINNGAATVTLNLTVNASDLGFLVPTGNGTLSSSLSGTYKGGASVADGATFQSWANLSNTQFQTSGITGGPQSWSAPSIPAGSTSGINIPGSSTVNTTANGVTAPFALTNLFTFSLTIASGGSINLTGTTGLVATQPTVIPEPATITGGLLGLASLGLYRLRRRKAVAA
jgi:hypothetical protein